MLAFSYGQILSTTEMFLAKILLPCNPFQWRRDANLLEKLILGFVLPSRARHRKRLVNGIEIPLSKKKAGKEIPFCVLEKMRITYSNLDICKKNNLKSYRKESSGHLYGGTNVGYSDGAFYCSLFSSGRGRYTH